jgi:hypothetical protein
MLNALKKQYYDDMDLVAKSYDARRKQLTDMLEQLNTGDIAF